MKEDTWGLLRLDFPFPRLTRVDGGMHYTTMHLKWYVWASQSKLIEWFLAKRLKEWVSKRTSVGGVHVRTFWFTLLSKALRYHFWERIPILEIFNQIPVGHCDFNTTSPELHKATLELVWLDLFLFCFWGRTLVSVENPIWHSYAVLIVLWQCSRKKQLTFSLHHTYLAAEEAFLMSLWHSVMPLFL